MKGTLIAVTALLLAATLAPASAAPLVASGGTAFNWTGLYVGGTAGYGWASLNDHLSTELDGVPFYAIDRTNSAGGFLGGVRAGFDYQASSSLVIGIDGSWTWLDAAANLSCGNDAFALFSLAELECGEDGAVTGIGDVRGRVGLAFGRRQIYLAGGYAVAKVATQFSTNEPSPFTTFAADRLASGWTVGVGGEYAVTDNLILGLDYRYYDFAGSSQSGIVYPSGPTIAVFSQPRFSENVLSFSASFKFGGGN